MEWRTSANGGSHDQADGTMTNFADIGAARDKVLKVRLDQAAQSQQSSGTDSVAGTSTNIDPKGYLTSLSKTEFKAGEINVGDIKRASRPNGVGYQNEPSARTRLDCCSTIGRACW